MAMPTNSYKIFFINMHPFLIYASSKVYQRMVNIIARASNVLVYRSLISKDVVTCSRSMWAKCNLIVHIKAKFVFDK